MISKQNQNGDNDGPEPYIKLISNNGQEYYLKREYALMSETLREMMDTPGGRLTETNQLTLHYIDSAILAKVCKYLKSKYEFLMDISPEIPCFSISEDNLLEVIMAVQFFKC